MHDNVLIPENQHCGTVNLKCILLNARSIRNKAFLVDTEVIDTHNPHIVLITETWLSPDVDSCIFLCRQNYDYFERIEVQMEVE